VSSMGQNMYCVHLVILLVISAGQLLQPQHQRHRHAMMCGYRVVLCSAIGLAVLTFNVLFRVGLQVPCWRLLHGDLRWLVVMDASPVG
jgi:hypothetical protein